jgi:hypothetical protein
VFSPPPFDILASISYGCVVVLEIGIFLLVPVLNPRHYRRKRAKDEETTVVVPEPAEVKETMGHGEPPEGPLGWLGQPYEGLREENQAVVSKEGTT